MSTILSQSPIKHNVLSKNQPIKNRKVTVVTKEEVPFKKGDSIIGWENTIITKVTIIIYYHYPVQLMVAIVDFCQIYLITMASM